MLGTHILETDFLRKRRLQAALDSCQKEMSKLLPRNMQEHLRKWFSIKIGTSGVCDNDVTQDIQFSSTLFGLIFDAFRSVRQLIF